jgi:hypothetical protein
MFDSLLRPAQEWRQAVAVAPKTTVKRKHAIAANRLLTAKPPLCFDAGA